MFKRRVHANTALIIVVRRIIPTFLPVYVPFVQWCALFSSRSLPDNVDNAQFTKKNLTIAPRVSAVAIESWKTNVCYHFNNKKQTIGAVDTALC